MNIKIKNNTYFLYKNREKEIFFLITNGHDYIEEFNVTNYDFTEKDFNDFCKTAKLNAEEIENYKDTYKIKTELACYLFLYLGY